APCPQRFADADTRSSLVCCTRPPLRKCFLRSFPQVFRHTVPGRCCDWEPDRSTACTCAAGTPVAAACASLALADRQDERPASRPILPQRAPLPPEIAPIAAIILRAKWEASRPAQRC